LIQGASGAARRSLVISCSHQRHTTFPTSWRTVPSRREYCVHCHHPICYHQLLTSPFICPSRRSTVSSYRYVLPTSLFAFSRKKPIIITRCTACKPAVCCGHDVRLPATLPVTLVDCSFFTIRYPHHSSF